MAPVSAFVRLALLAVLAWLPCGAARADTQQCFVLNSLPITIASPGNYCLAKNFDQTFSGAAISILTHRVVLDCRGFSIRNAGTSLLGHAGIYVDDGSTNVTIRNCTIDHFSYGIALNGFGETGTVGNTIVDNHVLRSNVHGIYASGTRNKILRNRVSNTLGDTTSTASGIWVQSTGFGHGTEIRDNIVTDIRPTYAEGSAYTYGIAVINLRDVEISGNVVSGLYARTGNGSYGIYVQETSEASVHDNVVLSPVSQLQPPYDGGNYAGIWMIQGNDATVVCRDNVVGHFNSNTFGCVAADNTTF